MKNRQKKEATIAKGYRLKCSTHKKVKKARQLLNLSYDSIFCMSLNLLLKKNKKDKNNYLINNNEKGIQL
ncbi:MAG: hypothetical protein IT281_04385 [Ignavibacteria bacterium]|nr:hypothetical protein [Ignavibacteria bacterium]MCC7158759.1 hypothetical protein [Ignavibacteria bacterium]